MSLLQQALTAFGNRERMTSGELLYRLDPDYLAHYGSRQRGGYHGRVPLVVEKRMGVAPVGHVMRRS
jgi:hypothetical protein